jgi:5-methylthioribose kinase
MNYTTLQTLPGGISSDIAIVEDNGLRYVVKAALSRLRVAADWRSDPARSHVEVEALRVAEELLGPERVPHVLWDDQEAHRFAMDLVGPQFHNWKTELLAGRVDYDTATSAGEVLGLLHSRSSTRLDLRERFGDTRYFYELRVVPYFLRIACVHPVIAGHIERMIADIENHSAALVHGDFSPKNLLVDGSRIVVLDWEVAHWGDPRFDVAFCLTHLFLKHCRGQGSMQAAISAYLDAYFANGLRIDDRGLVMQFAALVLARIDGDSPVDYLGDVNVDRIRQASIGMLLGDAAEIRLALRAMAA